MTRRFQGGGLNALDDGDDDATVMDPDTDEGDDSSQPAGAVTSAGGLSALDIPGAKEAFTLMQRSAADARKALQEARTSIMGRQYSKADALLAASAALGAPTRSGSTAESFAAMAGALRGPLAAKREFETQQQKDLLGVNTQLAGLDEREATARLALAQVQARIAAQSANTPLEKVLVPGQEHPVGMTRLDARGKPLWTPPGSQTNVNVSADKSLYGKMAEQLGEEYVGQYKSALNAQSMLDRNAQVQDLLKANPYTGSLAEWKLKLGKGAKALGINYAGDDVTNTERLFSTLGNNVLENIHGSGLGSGNGFTDKDLEFLRQVKGGSINLDEKTIGYLSSLSDRAARLSTQKWNRTYGLLKPDLLKQLGLTPVNLRDPGPSGAAATGPAAPAAATAPDVAPANTPAAGAAAGAGDTAAAGAPYGLAPAQWAIDPANPPPRASPAAEKALKEHPEKQQEFVDKFQYLPNGG